MKWRARVPIWPAPPSLLRRAGKVAADQALVREAQMRLTHASITAPLPVRWSRVWSRRVRR
jgi:hypothetical protein